MDIQILYEGKSLKDRTIMRKEGKLGENMENLGKTSLCGEK
jgi:hypothetical protein